MFIFWFTRLSDKKSNFLPFNMSLNIILFDSSSDDELEDIVKPTKPNFLLDLSSDDSDEGKNT